MTPAEFRSQASAPKVAAPLEALWWAAQGDWNRAHKIVQDDGGKDAAWVHAYLHRVEGDLPNARYWYHQATRPASNTSLEDEWNSIVQSLLVADSKR